MVVFDYIINMEYKIYVYKFVDYGVYVYVYIFVTYKTIFNETLW